MLATATVQRSHPNSFPPRRAGKLLHRNYKHNRRVLDCSSISLGKFSRKRLRLIGSGFPLLPSLSEAPSFSQSALAQTLRKLPRCTYRSHVRQNHPVLPAVDCAVNRLCLVSTSCRKFRWLELKKT